jgi:hypothetical protein
MSNHEPVDAGNAELKKRLTGAGAVLGFATSQAIGASIVVPTSIIAMVAAPYALAAIGVAGGAYGGYKLAKSILAHKKKKSYEG